MMKHSRNCTATAAWLGWSVFLIARAHRRQRTSTALLLLAGMAFIAGCSSPDSSNYASTAPQNPPATTPGAQFAATPADSHKFVFGHEPDNPLTYSLAMTVKMNMDMKSGRQDAAMNMNFDLRYRLKLTPTADSKESLTSMRLEPSGVEGDWDMTGPGGHMIMSLRDSKMKGTQNGRVVIDTAKDIGTAQAQAMKKEIMPLYLSGFVDLDPRGMVKAFRGDLPFVEFWTEAMSSQVGLWGVVFPAKEVKVGDSWEETLSLKKMGQVKMDGEGLRCTATFARGPDVVVKGKRRATFTQSAPFKQKNLTARVEQMGQNMRVNISEFERRAEGTFNFDQERGLVTDGRTKADATASMSTFVQGQAIDMNLKMQMEMRVNLVGDGRRGGRKD